MRRSPRLPRGTTISSREFNQHTSRAKKAAEHGPVFITDRGRTAYVLMTARVFRQLAEEPIGLADALADPAFDPAAPDLAEFIPERRIDPDRFAFEDER